ncbi:MAG: alpha-amylase family protein [Eubacteriales bacterium]|nr:alpha-amylase family protein [Eubacteriales bacterium]
MKTKKSQSEQYFEKRLGIFYDELKWLYMELYPDCGTQFENLLLLMREAYHVRRPNLKKLDEMRKENTQWYKANNLIGMMMYTDAFAGDLNGVKKKLDYIESCHVNYVHLMPLLASPEGKSDGGYAVADFRSVQPELGTMKDLEDLTDACHKRNICICLDFVMNHTSEEHEWAKRARQGEREYMDRYYFYDSYDVPSEFEKTVPQVFPTTAPGNFTWLPDIGKYVMTTFYPYQWDLNYWNPVVLNEMIDNMLYLANRGVDILRLDAVPYIWKQFGTNCRNLPQVHNIVRIMRIVTEIVCPGVLLLGEVVMEPSKVVPYFGNIDKPECHLLYNVTTMATTWHTVATKDVRLLKRQMDIVNRLPKQYVFLNYLRCHDDIGWGLDYEWLKEFSISEISHKQYLNEYLTGKYQGSVGRGELYNSDPISKDARLCGTTASLCGLEKALYERDADGIKQAAQRVIMLHAYLLTQSGIPVLYSGDEIGQLNDYSYHEDPMKCTDSRYLHRGKFQWDLQKKIQEENTSQHQIFYALQKLETFRAEHKVFGAQADVELIETYDNSILGIKRSWENEKLIALFNFSDEEKTAWIQEHGKYTDVMSEKQKEGKAVSVPAGSFCWLYQGEREKIL